MPVTLSGPVPVFDMERVRLAVALTPTLPNEKFPERDIMRLWIPLPVAGMEELPRLVAIVIFALYDCSAVGRNEKVTSRVVFPATVRFPVTLAVSHTGGAGTENVTLPDELFLMDSERLEVWFTVTFPKARLPVTVICGAADIPVPTAGSIELPALEATVMFELKVPATEGWKRTVTFCEAPEATVRFEELPTRAKRGAFEEVIAVTVRGPEEGL